jgi:hypothetical protein
MDKAGADVRSMPFRASQLPVGGHLVRQTRMAAAIGQVATLGRRPHRNTPPNRRASRADQLLAWAEKVPVGAGGLLTPLEGKAPAGFAAIAIGPLPDAVPQRAITEGDGWISPLPRTGQRPRRGAR